VRDEVLKTTANKQEPFVYGSLGGETLALVPAIIDKNAEARRDYEFAAQIGTKEAWQSFLAVHAAGLYADLARAQHAKLDQAEQASAKTEESRRLADERARGKAEDFRRILEEQASLQSQDATRQLAEHARREHDEARRQIVEHAKRELDESRRDADDARRQADDARRRVEEIRRRAVEDARRQVDEAKRQAEQTRIATLTPAAAPPMDPGDLARLLQAHLKRVGCEPGTTDGNWSDGSRKAMEQFNKFAGTALDAKLASLDALDAVRAKTTRVCPLVCGKGQRVENDRCIQITCDSGFMLGADGNCIKRPAQAQRPAPQQQSRASSAPAAGGGPKCFTFNGKRFCE